MSALQAVQLDLLCGTWYFFMLLVSFYSFIFEIINAL